MQIGCHVSIAGSFDKCIDRASERGANCLQTFASSPRSLKTKDFSKAVVSVYLAKKKVAKMGAHFFHAPYLINLAHEDRDYVRACVKNLIFYQRFSERIQGKGTIFHIGSHKGKGFLEVFERVVKAISEVLIKTPDGVQLILENAAGQKGVIGDRFSDLGKIISAIPKKLIGRIGVCLDSQHAFASGYELRNENGLNLMIQEFENYIGLRYLKVIHVNDSKVELGGNRDRHENIGEGAIGKEGFRRLVNHKKLRHLPFILEVPGEKRSGPRKEDVDLIKNLLE